MNLTTLPRTCSDLTAILCVSACVLTTAAAHATTRLQWFVRRSRAHPVYASHPCTPAIPAYLVSRMLSPARLRDPLPSCVIHRFMIHAPSLQPHYRVFITNTGMSVPGCRYVLQAGSHVPWTGLTRALAVLTPDAARSINRLASALVGGWLYNPVLTSVQISTLHRSVHLRSTSRSSRDSRSLPFPESLPTTSMTTQQHQVI